jgi:hypothetical protein
MTISDDSQQPWAQAEPWQRESAIRGVAFAVEHPEALPSTQQGAWLADKVMDGWTYGALKDTQAKTHPCMVPYEQLPVAQQRKDALFTAIVRALSRT